MLSKKALEQVINEYKGDDLSGYLIQIFDKIKEIRSAKFKIEREVEKAREDFEKMKADSEKKLGALMTICHHWESHFNEDPAGGSDSFYRCSICGYEW